MTQLLLCIVLFAGEPCISGVAVGKRPGPYSFLVATGEHRGKQSCFICEQAEKPAVVVFSRSTNKPLGKLLVGLDAEMPKQKEKGFKAWMTLLAEKGDLDQLAKWSHETGLKNLAVGVFENKDGPPSYTINDDAEVTILLFTKEKVVLNFAFRAEEWNEEAAKKVLEALPKFLDTK